MLIEFKVANFLCFKDEVTLDLRPAGRDREHLGNIWEGRRHRALKSVALFGPNASGKTSLLHALSVFTDFVTHSVTRMNVGHMIRGIVPFKLSKSTASRPSAFEVLLELDGAGYRYRIEVTRDKVLREVLERQDAAKNSAWLTLIDRDVPAERCELHERLGSEARRKRIIEDTRDNALILSRAAERNVQLLVPLYEWFDWNVKHLPAGTADGSLDSHHLRAIAKIASAKPELLARLTDFICDADTGIARIGIENDPLGGSDFALEDEPDESALVSKTLMTLYQETQDRVIQTLTSDYGRFGDVPSPFKEFYTEHDGNDGKPVRFSLTEESHGTLRYLRLMASFLLQCREGCLMAVDELHTGLHPLLARRALQMVHSAEFGRAGAQLLFTTHDATLLDPNLLRRDQIMLMQKGSDGAAELYSLWDFEKMPRNSAAWARNYLAGRFGGVPVFGPSLADIPREEQPTALVASGHEKPAQDR